MNETWKKKETLQHLFLHICYLVVTQSLTDHKLRGSGRWRFLSVVFTWGPRWCLCLGQSFWGISPSSGPAHFEPTAATSAVWPVWVSTPCFHSPARPGSPHSTPVYRDVCDSQTEIIKFLLLAFTVLLMFIFSFTRLHKTVIKTL